MSTNLQQVLDEARKRAAVAVKTEAEYAAQALLATVVRRLADAEVTATEAVFNSEAANVAWRNAGEVVDKTTKDAEAKAKTKEQAEVELTRATEALAVADAARDLTIAEQKEAAKVAQKAAQAKANAEKALTAAREELAKIQPPAPPVPAPVPAEPAPAIGFWTRLFKRQPAQPEAPAMADVVCPTCWQRTPAGKFCEACGGAL